MLTEQAWQALLAEARVHSRPWPTRYQTQALESLAPRLSQVLAAIEACDAGSTRAAIARNLPKLDDALTVWLRAAARVGGAGSDILAAEKEAGRRDPFRQLAALTHTIARVEEIRH